MLTKIKSLIEINKKRLEELNKKKNKAENEYQEALYEGMIQELENSIEDLEEIIK